MARLNILKLSGLFGFAPKTHEGAPARAVTPELALRRSVLACLLWENQFYEDGVEIAGRIAELVPKVSGERVAALAVEAREKMKLRHVPLLLVREMARHKTQRGLVAQTLAQVIQRADELAEFVAIYWKDGKTPLSAQVKKGLAAAFTKFDKYQLAKYDRSGPIKLRDVLFLSHAKPRDEAQAEVWKRLVEGRLAVPNTWEVALSATRGEEKGKAWADLLERKRLGAMALLRNLRNMEQAEVAPEMIRKALAECQPGRVLPFRFIAAAKHAVRFEPELEQAMFRCVDQVEKLPGRTILVVDVSGSMQGRIAGKTEMTRVDVAAALAILVREVCEQADIYCTAGNDGTRVHATEVIAPRRGFALRDAIVLSQNRLGGGGIFLTQCLAFIGRRVKGGADRIIVMTDEQDCETNPLKSPERADAFGKRNYLINVAVNKHGIGYKPKWLHIDGWSEAVIDYIRALEQLEAR